MVRLRFFILSLAVVLAASVTSGCSRDDGFSTDSRQILSFPSDVISLDSVISGMKSPSVMFMVYNNNDRAIRFDAFLVGGSGSVFEMMADGIGGNAACGLEVGANDSVVFVMRTNTRYRDDGPSTVYSDTIRFILGNGAVQHLPVRVTSVNARMLKSYRVQGIEMLDSAMPYLILDSLYVPFGTTLKIAPGTRLYFYSGAGIAVDGRIVAEGSRDSRIIFSGHRLDCATSELPFDLLDGQWKGIRLGRDSYGNRFEWCDIHGAENGIVADSSDIGKVKADIVSSVIHNMTRNCIEAKGCKVSIANSQITNSGECCLNVTGGETSVMFSTIADFSVWHRARVAVSIIDRLSETDERPFGGASFDGCIITGRHPDEIEVSAGLKSDWENRLRISHSLVMTRDSLSGFFSDCRFEKQKTGLVYGAGNFVASPVRYDCSFRLDSISGARGIGGNASLCPTDLDGNARPEENPDAGCYQYVPLNP